jgi:hypothetical protein
MTEYEDHVRRMKLIKLADTLVWAFLWVGICLLLAYVVLAGRIDLP